MATPIAALTCASVNQSQGATESANAEDNGTAEANSVVAKHFSSLPKAMVNLRPTTGKSKRQCAVAYSPPANNSHAAGQAGFKSLRQVFVDAPDRRVIRMRKAARSTFGG
jgi:hypothetical protein